MNPPKNYGIRFNRLVAKATRILSATIFMLNELVLENSSTLLFSQLFSQQRLIEELEKITLLESDKQCKRWIHSSKLTELFFEKHKVGLEEMIQIQGHGNNLREFLKSSKIFSIYGTSDPNRFYLAIFSSLHSMLSQNGANPEDNMDCPSYESDSYLAIVLEEDTQSQQFNQANNPIKTYADLICEIASLSDLEVVLIKIIQQLWINSSKREVTIATLSQEFYTCYKQPIRAVIRNICPDIRLIEILQILPNLQVQKVDNDWYVIPK